MTVFSGINDLSTNLSFIPNLLRGLRALGEMDIPAPYSLTTSALSKTMVLIPCSFKAQPAVRPAIPPPIIPICDE